MPQEGQVASTFTIVGIALASTLVPLNSTMIAVALPTLADEFDITKGHAGVLITVYLVAMLVGQPTAGRLADQIGARRLAIIAVTGFGLCSAAAMFATTFATLVAIRAGQAIFASALSPSVQALVRKVTGSETRGRAFGLQGSVIGAGAGLGPVVGGLLLAAFGWRAIFAINLPIVIVVLIVLQRSVPATVDAADSAHRRRLVDGVDRPEATAHRQPNVRRSVLDSGIGGLRAVCAPADLSDTPGRSRVGHRRDRTRVVSIDTRHGRDEPDRGSTG